METWEGRPFWRGAAWAEIFMKWRNQPCHFLGEVSGRGKRKFWVPWGLNKIVQKPLNMQQALITRDLLRWKPSPTQIGGMFLNGNLCAGSIKVCFLIVFSSSDSTSPNIYSWSSVTTSFLSLGCWWVYVVLPECTYCFQVWAEQLWNTWGNL